MQREEERTSSADSRTTATPECLKTIFIIFGLAASLGAGGTATSTVAVGSGRVEDAFDEVPGLGVVSRPALQWVPLVRAICCSSHGGCAHSCSPSDEITMAFGSGRVDLPRCLAGSGSAPDISESTISMTCFSFPLFFLFKGLAATGKGLA